MNSILIDRIINTLETTPVRDVFDLGGIIGVTVGRDLTPLELDDLIEGIRNGRSAIDRCSDRKYAKEVTDLPNL